jgi:hypothetical protein
MCNFEINLALFYGKLIVASISAFNDLFEQADRGNWGVELNSVAVPVGFHLGLCAIEYPPNGNTRKLHAIVQMWSPVASQGVG